MLAKRKHTLSGLHRALGIDMGYLSRIFAGKQCPSLSVAEMIAAHVGWTLDEFTIMLRDKQQEWQTVQRNKSQREQVDNDQITPEGGTEDSQESETARQTQGVSQVP